GVIAARGLDCAFQRFGTRIGEEDAVGKAVGGQPFGQTALARDFIEIGDVPELSGLGRQRLYQMRMGVPQRIDRDTGSEVQKGLAVLGMEPSPLTALEHHWSAGKARIQGCFGHVEGSGVTIAGRDLSRKTAENKKPPTGRK